MPSLGVVVPAGGRGRRLAGHKLAADVAGRPLLDRTLDGLPEDAVIVCVGPSMPTDRDVLWVQETPVFGGPLAAVAAGEAALPPLVTTVLLVGGDMPAAGLAIPALLAAVTGDAGAAVTCAVISDANGRRQPLLSAWRRAVLREQVDALAPTDGRPLNALLDGFSGSKSRRLLEVEDTWGAAADVDTPADLAASRDRYDQQTP